MTALAYIVCALVWGTTWFAIRLCLQGYAPFLGIALRLTLAAVVLMTGCALFVRPPRWPARTAFALLGAGILNATSFACIYQAERSITGGLAAVLFGTMPLMTAAVATVMGTEQMRVRALPGALAALAGVVLIYSHSLGSASGTGVVLALGAVLASSIFTVIVKRAGATLHPLASSAMFITSSATCAWIITVVAGQSTLPAPLPTTPTLAILYLALMGSVIVFVFYFTLLKRVSAFTATTMVFIEPIIALAIDHIWEREPLAASTYAGIVMTLLGVALTLWLTERKTA